MTRVLRLSRLSPLLILAAALVALAVFFVNYNAPPASADHGRDEDVWSGTLRVRVDSGFKGCHGSTSQTLCSITNNLSDDDFTYAGVEYTLDEIKLTTQNQLQVSFTGEIPASLKSALVLSVAGRQFRLANANFVSVNGPNDGVNWPNPGLSWNAGQTVKLKLIRQYWTGVDLYGGNMEHQADGYQYMNINEGGSNGTFWVKLDQAPTADVTVTIGKLSTFEIDDFDAATVSPQTLTFTSGSSGNWGTGQKVTVTAATDGDGADDRIIISARVSIASGADADDPYRNPERVNGFVLTVKDTTVGGG